jgi:hypothetical protein
MKNFYFNGELMPPYSNMWSWCNFGFVLNHFEDDWDSVVGYKNIWLLKCKIDHEDVESEDPEVFLVCVQELILAVLQHRDEILNSVSQRANVDMRAEQIVENILAGLKRMRVLCKKLGYAMWVTGDNSAQELLCEYIRRCTSSEIDTERWEFPHVSAAAREVKFRIELQEQKLALLDSLN